MRLLHLPDGIRQRIRIYIRVQLHIAPVPVVPQPVVGAPFAVGWHRKQDVIIQRAVIREILEDALDGKLQIDDVSVADLLADALPDPTHFFSERAGHHYGPKLRERLHRIAGKDRPVEDLEETGIGTDQRGFQLVSVFIQIGVYVVEHIGGTGTHLDPRDLFHEAHGDSAAHLAIVVFVPILGVPSIDGIHPVDVLVEAVITQFKEHLGNEHDSHRQPHTQGQDLD